MSNDYSSHRILFGEDIRLLQRVFDRIEAKGAISRRPLRREAFAAFLLDMYFRGLVHEDALFGLALVAARARFNRPTGLSFCKVLLVEDDRVKAMEIKRLFEKAGAHVIGPFDSEGEILNILQREAPDLAVLDINLGDGPSFAIAEWLSLQDVPLCFISASAPSQFRPLPVSLAHMHWVEKPATAQLILAAAVDLLDHRQ